EDAALHRQRLLVQRPRLVEVAAPPGDGAEVVGGDGDLVVVGPVRAFEGTEGVFAEGFRVLVLAEGIEDGRERGAVSGHRRVIDAKQRLPDVSGATGWRLGGGVVATGVRQAAEVM